MPRLAVIKIDQLNVSCDTIVSSCLVCPNRSSTDYKYDEATGRYYTHCLEFLPPEKIWASEVGTIPAWCPLEEVDPAVPPSPPSP